MSELFHSLLTIIAVGSAGICFYLNSKNKKKVMQLKQHKERIEALTDDIKKMMDEAGNTKADYEEAKRVFREAQRKDAETK